MNDKQKTTLVIVIGVVIVAVICLCLVFATGIAGLSYYQLGTTTDSSPATIPDLPIFENSTSSETNTDLGITFAPMWESRQILIDEFVYQPVEDTVLAQGALDGITLYMEENKLSLPTVSAGDEGNVMIMSKEAGTPEEAANAFLPFWEQWYAILKTNPEDLDITSLFDSALRGMIDGLGDPYTFYMDPEEYKEFTQVINGNAYEGIGAFVDTSQDYLMITYPINGSPAEAAGLRTNDYVIAIDGVDMTGVDPEMARQKILGPSGSEVVITIRRPGTDEVFDVTIIRAEITTPNVMYELRDDGLGYIFLNSFGEEAGPQLHAALQDLLDQGATGLIFDMRYNGGGYLDTAIDVTSEFIDGGILFHKVYSDGSEDTHYLKTGGIATDIPMVVLINEYTISAAEVTAGAFQDYGRATLVGTTTFGKGLVQAPFYLQSNQSVLKVTISYWVTPEEREINKNGITPDIVVEITDEDYQKGIDPQLEKAVEILVDN
ncbi:MAG: S41 family peptidase [Anaerolineales bacterium]|nr:S41 family peptidase [Anaerolineales bacterium]